MASLSLQFEPIAVDAGVKELAEKVTWGRLEVRAASDGVESILTRVLDRRANGMRSGVDGTVLPLAEWLARSYLHVFSTARLPPTPQTPRREVYGWRRSHCLRFAGEGAALPDACLWRGAAGRTSLRWERDDEAGSPGQPVVFLSEGELDLPAEVAKQAVKGFVDSVLRRCERDAPDDPRTRDLRASWNLALDSSAPDHLPALMAAQLGEVWAHLPEESRQLLREVAGNRNEWLDALLSIGDLEQVENVLAASEEARSAAHAMAPRDASLQNLRSRLTMTTSGMPWERGWRDAQQLRRLLDKPDDQPLDLQRFPLLVERETSLEGLLIGKESLVTWAPSKQPVALGPSKSRFFRVRDAWAPLFTGDGGHSEAVLLTPRLAGVTSVANAFAAELIAPRDAVQQLIGTRSVLDGDDIADIASELTAPWGCVRHQIGNHRMASVVLDS